MLRFAQYEEKEAPIDVSVGHDEAAERILLVDDEEMVRTMFAAYLSQKYTCVTAESTDEALTKLANDAYVLVVSDIQMPGRNGVELLREIRMRYPDTPVIMMSGIDRPQR